MKRLNFQVLAQYRKFLRTARRLPASEREEIEDMVKYDFRYVALMSFYKDGTLKKNIFPFQNEC